jgi:hypothetical protein
MSAPVLPVNMLDMMMMCHAATEGREVEAAVLIFRCGGVWRIAYDMPPGMAREAAQQLGNAAVAVTKHQQ